MADPKKPDTAKHIPDRKPPPNYEKGSNRPLNESYEQSPIPQRPPPKPPQRD